MLRPDLDRLRLTACSNGWFIDHETWDADKQIWLCGNTEVYQDPEVVLSVLREQLIQVMPGGSPVSVNGGEKQ